MYKTPLTATVFKDFSSTYQQLVPPTIKDYEGPFVYVDGSGVKIVTGVIDEAHKSVDGIFALSMAKDGLVEMLSLSEAS